MFLLVAGICMTSCSPVLRFFSGIRQPRIESIGSVKDYLEKNRIETFDTLYTCRDSARAMALIKHIINLPSTLLFDSSGLSVQQSDSGFCPAKVEQYMRNLSEASPIIHDNMGTRSEILQYISPVASHPGKFSKPEFHLYVFWATYCGSLNDNVFKVLTAAYDNPNADISISLVNVDFLGSWGIKEVPGFSYK